MNKLAKYFKIFWLFYPKLIFPSAAVAALLAYTQGDKRFVLGLAGMSFLIATPLLHYFIYELSNPNVYYFYYNMGWTRLSLWIVTISISTLVGFILMSL